MFGFIKYLIETKYYHNDSTIQRNNDRIKKYTPIHNILVKKYNKYKFKDKKTIENYIKGGSRKINLQTGKKDNLSIRTRNIADNIRKLSAAAQRHETPGAMIVHHGVKHHHLNFFNDIIKNKKEVTLQPTGFTSTSIDPQLAHTFKSMNKIGKDTHYTSHILHIHIPKGSAGSYVGHLSDLSYEKEFIINKRAKMMINPKPISIERNPDKREGYTYHWRAHLIHDGTKDV